MIKYYQLRLGGRIMEILNRTLIKSEAKVFISQDRKWLTMALACLPLMLLQGAISTGIEIVVEYSENGDFIPSTSSTGSSIIAWLLIPFTIGMAGYFLNHLRGNNPDMKSLYREGLDFYGKYFKVGVITQLIIFLWALLLIVPGIIKGYEYHFVHQIMHDNPELDHKHARDLSKRMTYGFKLEIFEMEISFFFWVLLIVFTFGIAYLYFGPYYACTNAMYYENLKHHAITTGVASPEEFGFLPVQEEVTPQAEYEDVVVPSYIEEPIETAVIEEIVEEDEINTEE